jgi:hypothetical protein
MCPAPNISDIDVHKGPFEFLRCIEGTKNDDLDKNEPWLFSFNTQDKTVK